MDFVIQIFEPIIECKYQTVHEFSEGYAAVKINDKYGVIDKLGKLVN